MNLNAMLPARYSVRENPLKTERRLELAAIVLVVLIVLALVLGLAGQAASGGPSALPPAADSLKLKVLRLGAGLPEEAVSAVLARPLFWEGRRPMVANAPVAAKPKPVTAAKLEGVTLHGVFGAGDSLGLIATVDGRMGRIAVGESVKGWQLSAYEDGVAVFSREGRRATLPLELTTPTVKIVQASSESADIEENMSTGKGAAEAAAQTGAPTNARIRPLDNEGGGLSFGGSGYKGKEK